MGHRFSKSAANNIAAKTTSTNETTFNTTITSTTSSIIPIPNVKQQQQQFIRPTTNSQIQENPTNCSGNSNTTGSSVDKHTTADILQQQYTTNNSISSSLTSVNNLSCGRQIIIKIQLAKMENGNEASSLSQHQQQLQQDISLENMPADCNLNSTELSTTVTAAGIQFLNLTLNNNTSCSSSSTSSSSSNNFNSMANSNTTAAAIAATSITTSSSSLTLSSAPLFRTAGSSLNKNNNYLNSNSAATCSGSGNNSIMSTLNILERPERLNSLQFNDEIVEQNIGEIVEYCEVLEDHHQQALTNSSSSYNSMQMLSINEEANNEANVCCRSKSKSLAANGGSSISNSNNSGAKTKSRCRKCSCRDAFRRFLDPSLSRSSNKANKQQKEQKRNKSQERHSINNPTLNNTSKQRSMHSTIMRTNTTNPTTVATTTAIVVPPTVSNQVSLWGSSTAATNSNDVIIPLSTPAASQFVVVQCAIVNPTNATLHPLSNANATPSHNLMANNLISIAAQDVTASTSTFSASNDLMVKVPCNSKRPGASVASLAGPIVHSQVDFVHYLVPDLERITNSSFYWGKMDRYEAERLLEAKPEGTFLLRDSAQEEFLFSVTFRKYGRSLHARIEQSEHRFSFDCHDPCVFTAATVTGLLEHYKDPACVMFFEPMLTIPLHRKKCFSLQKLCRATIVSNTTYDGINELELPARLKSYLKEYHYKQKLRVKSNEPNYTLHCK